MHCVYLLLQRQHPETQLNIFLMSDAVTGTGFITTQRGYNLQQMLEIFNGTKRPC